MIYLMGTCFFFFVPIGKIRKIMSGESGSDIVQSFPFTHAAHNRNFSVSDVFSPAGYTLFGLGEGWRFGKACRRQDRNVINMPTPSL